MSVYWWYKYCQRGNLVLWSSRFLDALTSIKGDTGSRHLIGEYAELFIRSRLVRLYGLIRTHRGRWSKPVASLAISRNYAFHPFAHAIHAKFAQLPVQQLPILGWKGLPPCHLNYQCPELALRFVPSTHSRPSEYTSMIPFQSTIWSDAREKSTMENSETSET